MKKLAAGMAVLATANSTVEVRQVPLGNLVFKARRTLVVRAAKEGA